MNWIVNPRSKTTTKLNYELVMLMGFALAGAIAAFPFRYIVSTNVLIGLGLIPFALLIGNRSRFNYWYFVFLLLFASIGLAFQLKIFYFFTIAFFLLFLLELFVGRVNTLVLFLIAVMSPVFHQVSVILGFPIRLKLSEWAGLLLNTAGLDVKTEGNMMLLDGYSFTVDEACMGLNMLAISLMMGVFVLSHHCKKANRELSLKYLIIFFLTVFTLNIISNLFRIIFLVLFRILPEDPMHEIIGIIGLLIYVMIPLFFLAGIMIRRKGTAIDARFSPVPLTLLNRVIVIALGILVMTIGFMMKPNRAELLIAHSEVKMAGMNPVKMDGGITKMFNDEVLIYIKPIPEFFSGEHTPLMCWEGSGYRFKKIRKRNIGNREIYCGTICKGEELLHTAWWYTDGKTSTIDQLTWRTAMLRGDSRFNIVNVTAKNEATVMKNVNAIFQDNVLVIK